MALIKVLIKLFTQLANIFYNPTGKRDNKRHINMSSQLHRYVRLSLHSPHWRIHRNPGFAGSCGGVGEEKRRQAVQQEWEGRHTERGSSFVRCCKAREPSEDSSPFCNQDKKKTSTTSRLPLPHVPSPTLWIRGGELDLANHSKGLNKEASIQWNHWELLILSHTQESGEE